MKNFTQRLSGIFSLVLLSSLVLTQSCTKDMCEVTETYTKFTPIYMSYEDMRAPDQVKSVAPQQLKSPGKIYFKDNFIFINEREKGVHVIDNANPSSPQTLAFIEIPGNLDIAVKGNILYADNYVDLLAINITDPNNISIATRVQDAIPYNRYQNFVSLDPSRGVVKEWIEEEITETYMTDCSSGGGGRDGFIQNDFATTSGVQNGVGGGLGGNPQNPNPGTAGTGGSMARFTIVNDYLYTVNTSSMVLFDITNTSVPFEGATVDIGWNIETIFPYGDKLFIGSSSGMYIYDNSVPSSPTQMSVLQHVTSCDPVVVQDNYAYVTLRGGNNCGGWNDQLDIIDISDPYAPRLMDTHEMDGPYGLGVDQESLFICDGESGLRVWNVADPLDAKEISVMEGFETYDVIPLNGHLLLIGPDGFYQFDYSDPNNLALLSVIPVVK